MELQTDKLRHNGRRVLTMLIRNQQQISNRSRLGLNMLPSLVVIRHVLMWRTSLERKP